MLIAWTNLTDAGTVTAGSQIATLPAAYTQNPHLCTQWHTAAGTKTSYLLWDLGSSQTCSVLFVGGTNLTSAATFRVRSSDITADCTANTEVDTGTVSNHVVTGYGTIYRTFAATASRYWRLDLSDTTVPSNLQVGRVFLGPAWTPDHGMSYGWGIQSLDRSRRTLSLGGQSHLDVHTQTRVLQFSLDWNSEAQMMGNAFALARAQGVVKDVLMIPDPAATYLHQQSVWGLLAESQLIVNALVGIWRQKFTVEERL